MLAGVAVEVPSTLPVALAVDVASVVAVGSNMTEGDGRFDGNGRERLRTAMYEAKETRDHLEIAVAAGAIAEDAVVEAQDLADKIAATLFKIVGQRR